jgi:peroxiredoxin
MDQYNVTFADGHRGYAVDDVEAQVGRAAPGFVLETVDHTPMSLEDHRDREHVILVFGSIT